MYQELMAQATEQRILCPLCRASNRSDARFCQNCGGDMLLDNIYRITKVIKEGGMGVVYKAIDVAGVEYAIKEMRDNFATEEERKEGIERFVEEANLLHSLSHPAIPRVYRSFIDEGRYYLAMEFIYGEDLEDVLKREKRFPEPVVLRWADQLCDVLDYMHSAGLIYRDMKPANIMIDRDDNVKLVDFGIAKLLQPGQRNTMVGTPGYAPPEQYQGLATMESDIYSLAATIHHLVTGRDPRDHPPFTFPLATTINRAVSVQTAKALEKALDMEIADRFHSASAFCRALPLPTGDRRPTRPFDVERNGVPQPVQAPAPQPARAPAPQAFPVPVTRSAPQAQPTRQARPRRTGRVRRVLAAVVLAVGLGGAGVALVPNALPAIQNLIQQVTQSNPAPAAITSKAIPLEITVSISRDANYDDIVRAMREQYLSQVKQQYPSATLHAGSTPLLQGTAQAGPVVGDQQQYTATVSATFDIPNTQ
jgi:serine/threonine-protein kinase